MSQSPPPIAGPSKAGLSNRAEPPLLPQAVMEYLQQHGFDKALATFQQELAGGQGGGDGEKDADGDDEPMNGEARRGSGSGGREAIFKAPGPITLDYMVKRNIPQATAVSASTMSDQITPEFIAQSKYVVDQLSSRVEALDTEKAKSKEGGPYQPPFLDPTDRTEGYKRYRNWVDGSLDMWKTELDSLSFPLFAHIFLDLIEFNLMEAAREFFKTHSPQHEALHSSELSTLSSISGKHHVLIDPYVNRLRREKYVIRMSRNAYGILLQWLSGAGVDEEWDMGMHSLAGRAKEAVRAVVNSRIRFEVSKSHMPLDKVAIATSSGLLSSLLPNTTPEKFNSNGILKLGAVPLGEKLREEVIRTLRDEEDSPMQVDSELPNGTENGHDVEMKPPVPITLASDPDPSSGLVSPDATETLPPQPSFYKLADVKREVEIVREKRKMIRLGPGTSGTGVGGLPSVLAFTMFDGGEGVTSTEFSQDSSLMAVGSAESCIRLWSMKGEKLKDKSLDPLDGRIVEDAGQPMRKLIGHSGPVYSLSFDPTPGPAAPPRSMLSSSQDGSVRLWSLDTYSNLVVYRGHKDPVWDVEWGPGGVYFATASRDRTARLWSSDRVTPLRMYTGHLSDVDCVKFHPNSLYLATGSADKSCRLWDVQRGACIRLFLGHTDTVTTMAISPDGRLLASAGLDCSIYLWDLGSSRPFKKMTGHTGPIQSLSFSSESSLLVSGSLDCTVRCWDVQSSGGPRNSISDGESMRKASTSLIGNGLEMPSGELPLGVSDVNWEESGQTSDLLSTFSTKRTPIVKVGYTPRNLCMVAGYFVPPVQVSTGGLVNGHAKS
ncbi:transcription initiation factor TFIID subunit 5, partial [Tremellales sp. Uapishka_1]